MANTWANRARIMVLGVFCSAVVLNGFIRPALAADGPAGGAKKGLILNLEQSFEGYTLIAPSSTTTTWLIGNDGRVFHYWDGSEAVAQSAYLLENGHLLRGAARRARGSGVFRDGRGATASIEEFTWDGELVWQFEHSSDRYQLHHDMEMLPNGNVLMIAWERKTAEEVIAAGRNPTRLSDGELWPDKIIEVRPAGAKGGEIVWEWHTWDHLIQDLDAGKDNYGVVAEHPGRIDINFIGSRRSVADWTHFNSVDYNEKLDQILIGVRGFNEIWVIDHGTTTLEAAGHTGGRRGKGGDLLYRWGNPRTYGAGEPGDQMLFGVHSPEWIEAGRPGEGNIILFHNGINRPEGSYSSVEEIVPPINPEGGYDLTPGSAHEPAAPIWTYTAENKSDFLSRNVSGAQRQPNGNTLVCSGASGVLFEVTPDKRMVWKYDVSAKEMGGSQPTGGPAIRTAAGDRNRVFRVYRYPPDYPGLADRDPAN